MHDNLITLLQVSGAAIAGVLAKYGIDVIKEKNKDQRVDFQTLLRALNEEVRLLKQERRELIKVNAQLQARVLELETEVSILRDKVKTLENVNNGK